MAIHTASVPVSMIHKRRNYYLLRLLPNEPLESYIDLCANGYTSPWRDLSRLLRNWAQSGSAKHQFSSGRLVPRAIHLSSLLVSEREFANGPGSTREAPHNHCLCWPSLSRQSTTVTCLISHCAINGMMHRLGTRSRADMHGLLVC